MSACAAKTTEKKPTSAARQPHTGALARAAVKDHCECAECSRKKGVLQRSAVSQRTPNEVPPIVYDVLASSGRPLEPDTRAFMEERFDHDFSDVRVHTDARAAESARAVNARAYTVGRDVVFGGRTIDEPSVLAHELAHVVQQSSAGSSFTELSITHPSGIEETEADVSARAILAGQFAPKLTSGSIALSRLKLKPVGDSAGCAICKRPEKVGDEIHAIVQQDAIIEFMQGNLRIFAEDRRFPGRRPDIVVEAANYIAVGEIKAANSVELRKGEEEVRDYISYIKKFTKKSVIHMNFPFPIHNINRHGGKFFGYFRDAETPKNDQCLQELIVNFPQNGVYTYFCEPGGKILSKLPGCSCKEKERKKEKMKERAVRDIGDPIYLNRGFPKKDRRDNDDKKGKFEDPKKPENFDIKLPAAASVIVAAFLIQAALLRSVREQAAAVAKFIVDNPLTSAAIVAAIIAAGIAFAVAGPAILAALGMGASGSLSGVASLLAGSVATLAVTTP